MESAPLNENGAVARRPLPLPSASRVAKMTLFRHLLIALLLIVGAPVVANVSVSASAPVSTNIVPPLQLTPEGCLSAIAAAKKLHKRLEPKTINVLSWNVHKLEDSAAIAEVMGYRTANNILFLQEAVENQELFNSKPFSSFSIGYKTKRYSSGVLTLSDYPILVNCTYLHVEPWLRTPKATNIILLDIDGTLLLAANIHAINFTLRTKIFETQLNAIQQIFLAYDGPVVFGGDFNTWSEQRLRVLTRIANNANLSEVEFREDLRKQVFGSSLDRFFIRGIRIIESKSTVSTTSDHNPIFVTLELMPSE